MAEAVNPLHKASLLPAGEFMCAYQLRFADGGEHEYGVLHIGDKESCERLAALIPGVSYSGPRRVAECYVGVFPAHLGP